MAENTKAAGRITGSPLSGLCERVCIHVRKIFDGCMTRISDLTFEDISLNDVFPDDLTLPYTYTSAVVSGDTTVSNLTVTPIDNSGGRARITFDTEAPITVTFADSNGLTGNATGVVTYHRDIVLRVPEVSAFPYTVDAATSIVSRIGTISPDGRRVTFRCCFIQVVRVSAPVDILVPTYGYCEYPFCEEYSSSLCPGFFSLPLFPEDV